jgi:hypothetical protein
VPRRDGLAFDDSEPDSTTLSRDAEVGEVDVDPPIVGQPGRTSWSAPGWVHILDVSLRCKAGKCAFPDLPAHDRLGGSRELRVGITWEATRLRWTNGSQGDLS